MLLQVKLFYLKIHHSSEYYKIKEFVKNHIKGNEKENKMSWPHKHTNVVPIHESIKKEL